MRDDRTFIAMLERAGKVWSHRIERHMVGLERLGGESKVRLIGDYGVSGQEIHIGPNGETSTGLAIYVTGAELSRDRRWTRRLVQFATGGCLGTAHRRVALDNDYFGRGCRRWPALPNHGARNRPCAWRMAGRWCHRALCALYGS